MRLLPGAVASDFSVYEADFARDTGVVDQAQNPMESVRQLYLTHGNQFRFEEMQILTNAVILDGISRTGLMLND